MDVILHLNRKEAIAKLRNTKGDYKSGSGSDVKEMYSFTHSVSAFLL